MRCPAAGVPVEDAYDDMTNFAHFQKVAIDEITLELYLEWPKIVIIVISSKS